MPIIIKEISIIEVVLSLNNPKAAPVFVVLVKNILVI